MNWFERFAQWLYILLHLKQDPDEYYQRIKDRLAKMRRPEQEEENGGDVD